MTLVTVTLLLGTIGTSSWVEWIRTHLLPGLLLAGVKAVFHTKKLRIVEAGSFRKSNGSGLFLLKIHIRSAVGSNLVSPPLYASLL